MTCDYFFFFFGLASFSSLLFLFVPLPLLVISSRQEAMSLTASSHSLSEHSWSESVSGAHHLSAISMVTRPDAPPFFSILRLSVLFASDKDPGRDPSVETWCHFGWTVFHQVRQVDPNARLSAISGILSYLRDWSHLESKSGRFFTKLRC